MASLSSWAASSRFPDCASAKPKIVVRLRQIGIGHDCLLELLERARTIVLTPVQQTQARMGLGIIRFQFECFLIVRQRLLSVVLALPSQAQIVIAGRQFGAFLDGFLKEVRASSSFCCFSASTP